MKGCPCHLAETSECILCNNLNKRCNECHCPNWCGVCISQEFEWNGFKAKEGRKYFKCTISKKEIPNEDLFIFHIKINDYLLRSLTEIGSFVFLRREDDQPFFDTPISIMDVNKDSNEIIVAIEKKGVKTDNLNKLNENDSILVKGPFWNGVLGRRHVKNLKDKKAILICRGVGEAPLIPVLKNLKLQGNSVTVIVDNGNYPSCFIKEYLNEFANSVHFMNTFEKGNLTTEFKEYFENLLLEEKPSLVHCSGADILNYEIMKVVENANTKKLFDEINYTCCNNAKMCCGEGICGGCTRKNNDHKLRRLCKMQTDPKYILEGRRLF